MVEIPSSLQRDLSLPFNIGAPHRILSRETDLRKSGMDELIGPSTTKEGSSQSKRGHTEARSGDEDFVSPRSLNKKPKVEASSDDLSSVEGTQDGCGGSADLQKKRFASRVSSRRTREREKLRMEHFRVAKVQLEQKNKTLKEENEKLQDLIQEMKKQKAIGGGGRALVLLPPGGRPHQHTKSSSSSPPHEATRPLLSTSATAALNALEVARLSSQQLPPQAAPSYSMWNALASPAMEELSRMLPSSLPGAPQPSQQEQLLALLNSSSIPFYPGTAGSLVPAGALATSVLTPSQASFSPTTTPSLDNLSSQNAAFHELLSRLHRTHPN